MVHRGHTYFGENIHFPTINGSGIGFRLYPKREGVILFDTDGTKVHSTVVSI